MNSSTDTLVTIFPEAAEWAVQQIQDTASREEVWLSYYETVAGGVAREVSRLRVVEETRPARRVLEAVARNSRRHTRKSGVVSEDMVARAKQYPVAALLEKFGYQKRMGKYLCPFHTEKTPSLSVHRAKNYYKCFGCEAHGDSISMYRHLTGCSFHEAVKELQ